VNDASKGHIPLTKKTFGGILTRWLDHIEAGPGPQVREGQTPTRLDER
jgi:hypothetical protein